MRSPILLLIGITLVLALSAPAMYAQVPPGDLHEGTYFEVAFSHVWPMSTEPAMTRPYMLLISSRVAGTIRIRADRSTTLGAIDKEYPLQANKVLLVELKKQTIAGEPGQIFEGGVTVTSTVPITVSTYIAYFGNGSLTLHQPVAAWGKSYHTFNYPQDQFGVAANMYYRPGQIAVVASESATVVTVKPTARVASGGSVPKVIEKNEEFVFTLDAHEVLILTAAIDSTASHTSKTDLTGTLVTATKPVAVISGHTKGSVGIFPTTLPPTGMFASPAHFVRNCFSQSVLPDHLADVEFVTVPFLYTSAKNYPATVDTTTHQGEGDVVRVLAISDGTQVRRSNTDGSEFALVATLNAGQYYTDYYVNDATVWMTSKPAFVMQYGKSYAKVLPVGGIVASEEKGKVPIGDVQGHPTVEAGQGTMTVVPGTSQWVSDAMFYAPEGMDNFVNIVTRLPDAQNIDLHGVHFSPLGQTDFSVARSAIGAGDQRIIGRFGAKFMAWSYGSLDGLQQGRAYSQPVGVSRATSCSDTVATEIAQQRTTAVVSGAMDTTCSRIAYAFVAASRNVKLDSIVRTDRSAQAFVTMQDSLFTGTITIAFVTTGGRQTERTVLFDSAVCRDAIAIAITQEPSKATILASLDSECSEMQAHTILSTTNARINGSAKTDTTVILHVLHIDTTKAGSLSARFTSDNGTVTDTTVTFKGRPVLSAVNEAEEPLSVPTLTVTAYSIAQTFTVEFGTRLAAGGTLRMYNSEGALVLDLTNRMTSELTSIEVQTSGLATGLYFVVLKIEDNVIGAPVYLGR